MKVGDVVKVKRWGSEIFGTVREISEPIKGGYPEYRCYVDFSTHSKRHLSLWLERYCWYDFSEILEIVEGEQERSE